MRAAPGCNRKRDETPDGHSQYGPEAYERGSLCRLPVENRLRAPNSKEWRRKSRNNHDGSQGAKCPGRTRDPCDQNQHESYGNSEHGDSIESDRGYQVPPNRQQAAGRENPRHADDDDEESDEPCEKSHVLSLANGLSLQNHYRRRVAANGVGSPTRAPPRGLCAVGWLGGAACPAFLAGFAARPRRRQY
jgi:hypothetical protein